MKGQVYDLLTVSRETIY